MVRAEKTRRMVERMWTTTGAAPASQRIIDEIELLTRELVNRQAISRPAPTSVVYAYRELLERQYDRLDRLHTE